MTSLDPNLAAVLLCLMEFSQNCVPARFTELLKSAEALRSLVPMITGVEDEGEQDIAAHAFSRASSHFNFVVRRSYSMHLLEDEDEAQTTEARLARSLATPEKRLDFLLALSGLCCATLCGDALRRNPNSLSLWVEMIQVASNYPALAAFAPPIDSDALMARYDSLVETIHKQWDEQGLRVIDLVFPLFLPRIHAGALWLKLLQEGADKATIERIRQLEHRVLHFLNSTSGERWILQPYKHILPTDSLRGILNELLSRDLQLEAESDDSDRWIEKIFPLRRPAFRVTEGRIRKHHYVILFPVPSYFITEDDERLFKAAADHPLQFIRDHLKDLPRSVGTREVERHVARIEDLQNDEKLAAWSKTLAVGMTANAIAVALCNSFEWPSEVRPFITTFVSSLVLLFRRNSH